MEFDFIIETSFSRSEIGYWTGYCNAAIEQNMLSSEMGRKVGANDSNPQLQQAIKIFQKEFLLLIDTALTVRDFRHYTAQFSMTDSSIMDNMR